MHRLLFTLPKLQSSMARFALATGLRVSNVRDLMWSEVQDGMINIKASKTKAGKQLFVPMSEEAMKILQEQRDTQSKRRQAPEYVFTKRNGKPIGSRTSVTNGVWQRACERAEVGSVRFHDLRHTWATRHVLSGTPLPLLQKLGGWNSMAMLEKYTHLSSMDMKNFVNNGMSVPRNTYIQNERSDNGIEQDVLKEAQATSVAQKRASKMVVELGGIEPPTSTLPVLRSPSGAIAPHQSPTNVEGRNSTDTPKSCQALPHHYQIKPFSVMGGRLSPTQNGPRQTSTLESRFDERIATLQAIGSKLDPRRFHRTAP